jgi:RNA polymerase sigma factor (TIGR02999 family)
LSEEPPNRSDYDLTGLLQAWGRGELGARDQLMVVVYDELRRRAAARLRRERPGHVLQPTALVHEAYLRLVGQEHADWQNRAHFFAIASEMMRRILVDHARRRKMAKRSGGWARITLDDAVAQRDPPDVDVLDVDLALSELSSFDRRKSRVAELRFFGGLSLDEIALALGGSRATVEREWQAARAWLYRRMTHSPGTSTHDA